MKLYSGPLSMFGAKAQIAALEKGIAIDCEMVPFAPGDRYEPRHPEVLRINPKRQVPVLVDGEVEIFDSTQIFEYLEDRVPEPPLWPRDIAARALARRLELESDEVFFPHVIRLFDLQEAMQSPPAAAACAGCAALYRRLEAQLGDRAWLVGDAYTFADIGFYMAQLFAERKGAPLTAATPALLAWRARVGERAAVRAVVGPMMKFLASQDRPVPDHLQDHLRT